MHSIIRMKEISLKQAVHGRVKERECVVYVSICLSERAIEIEKEREKGEGGEAEQ